jgi:hypothetical protein
MLFVKSESKKQPSDGVENNLASDVNWGSPIPLQCAGLYKLILVQE